MDRNNRKHRKSKNRLRNALGSLQWAGVLICLALFANPVFAKDSANPNSGWQIVEEPHWGSQAQPNSIRGRGVRNGRFYNLIERQHRYDETAAAGVSYIRYIYTITNAAGLESGGQVSIDYDPSYQSVQLHKVLLHRDNQSIDQMDPANIKLLQRETELDQGLYNGEQTLHMLLPDQRVGDQIEISYSLIGKNPIFDNQVFGGATMQASVPIGNYYFKLRYPSTKTVHTRVYAGELTSDITDTRGFTEQVWTSKSTKPQKYQSNVPSAYIAQTEIQYSEFESWEEVSRWAAPLYSAGTVAPEIKSFAKRLKSESAMSMSRLHLQSPSCKTKYVTRESIAALAATSQMHLQLFLTAALATAKIKLYCWSQSLKSSA